MMSAKTAATMTQEAIFKFSTEAMQVIDGAISDVLDYEITTNSKQMKNSVDYPFVRYNFAQLVSTAEQQHYFQTLLTNYLKNHGYKNIEIRFSSRFMHVQFSW